MVKIPFLTHTPHHRWYVALAVILFLFFAAAIPIDDYYMQMARWSEMTHPDQEIPELSWYRYNAPWLVKDVFVMMPFAAIGWIFILSRYPGRVSLYCWSRPRPAWSIFWTILLGAYVSFLMIDLYFEAFIARLGCIAAKDAGRILLAITARAALVARPTSQVHQHASAHDKE